MKQIFSIVLLFALSGIVYAQENHPYQDASLPVEVRVNDLLGRMTLEEKVDQMSMTSLRHLEKDDDGNISMESVEKTFKGRSIGCLESPFVQVEDIAKRSQIADHYLRTETRLGIPAIQIAECLHGQLAHGATIFPQAIAQGSTWNTDLIKEMASCIALEASASGVDQALSPLFDLAIDPRYGRVEECFGEDKYLVSRMGEAFVTGMQGDPGLSRKGIEPGKLACTAKHFVGYSNPAAGLNLAPVSAGMREMRTTHLFPFETAVKKANIYSIMPAYNEVDGMPLHADPLWLRDILREEWGFNGYVFSDYEAIWMLEHFHHTAGNERETALQAIQAGVDLEASFPYAYPELVPLVKEGILDISLIDQAVANVLRVKFKLGLFDRPYNSTERVKTDVHTTKHIELARKIAEESAVLLKNDHQLLPLDISKIESIAVIGPNADQVQFGDYSCTKDNSAGVTVLEGIKHMVGDHVKVNYARGSEIISPDKSGFAEAVKTAESSDVTILVVGGTSSTLSGIGWGKDDPNDFPTCGEGFDRTDISIPGVQHELVKAVVATGKPVILVMIHGRAYSIAWEKEHVPAILDAWYPGEEGGNAIANILFGKVNPSGKMPVSIPKSVGHIPVSSSHKPSSRGFYHKRGSIENPGRDYVFSSPDPLYPMGFGLSYTTFGYSDLYFDKQTYTAKDTMRVSFTLKNSGQVQGKEVVQLYVNDLVSSVTTSVKSLQEFAKVDLAPGESKMIVLDVPCMELGLWDADLNYVIEPGVFEVMIGSSSQDIHLSSQITLFE